MKRTKILQNTATKPLYNLSIFLIFIRVLLFDSLVMKLVAANVRFKYWLFLGVDLFCKRCYYYCYEWYIYFYVFPSFILLKPALAELSFFSLGSEYTGTIWVKMAMRKAHIRFNWQNHINIAQKKFIKTLLRRLERVFRCTRARNLHTP